MKSSNSFLTPSNKKILEDPNAFEFKISEKILLKTALAHARYPNQEWSGILLYRPKGIISSPDFSVDCFDIIIQGIGSSAYTETHYDLSDLNEYLVANDLLEDYADGFIRIGHIHTHHNMSVFFSGTDNADLLNRAESFDNYLSIVVNNNLEFFGKIASVVTGEIEIKSLNIKDNVGNKVSFEDKEIIKDLELDLVYVKQGAIDLHSIPTHLENFLHGLDKLKKFSKPSIHGDYSKYAFNRPNRPSIESMSDEDSEDDWYSSNMFYPRR